MPSKKDEENVLASGKNKKIKKDAKKGLKDLPKVAPSIVESVPTIIPDPFPIPKVSFDLPNQQLPTYQDSRNAAVTFPNGTSAGPGSSDSSTTSNGSKKKPFVLSTSTTSENAIAIRIKELDQCCCAERPCISIVKEYCESSSLHGLRYIAEDGRHWTERVLWVLLCLCGFILTVYFIYPIWSKWNDKPTITTLDSTDHPVWEIEFPGVTVCPVNKIVESKLDNLMDREPWNIFSRKKIKSLARFLVDFKRYPRKELHESLQDESLQAIAESLGLANLTQLMQQVMPSCSEFLLGCWWQGNGENCSRIFQVRKTNDGFCCSFNTIKLSDEMDRTLFEKLMSTSKFNELERDGLAELTPDFLKSQQGNRFKMDPVVHIPEESKSKPRIRRLNSASYQRGLTLLMDAKSQDYFATSDNFVGFKVLIHNPRSYPEVEENTVVVAPAKETFIAVSASHTEGSKAILNFPFEGRSCLFKDEREFMKSEVTLFNEYSEENCFLECRTKLSLQKCGCLPYFYPRLDLMLRQRKEFQFLQNKTCDWKGWQCLQNSTELFDAIGPKKWNTINDGQAQDGTARLIDGAQCHCPPTCVRTTYKTSQSFGNFPNKVSGIVEEITNQFLETSGKVPRQEDLMLVHVFFKNLKVFKYHTDELFSWENILASFGGLVGLCTGFSFLSAAEFAYFFTLRCTLPICRKKRKEKLAMINDTDLVVVKVEE